jgi:hypothetical protein
VCETPPGPEVIQAWMQRLIHAIADKGRFEGMGGTLRVILDRLSDPLPELAFPLSPASRFALPHVASMLQSAARGDGAGFLDALEHLIGLGPGLTPSADDMLVGFLASHRMLSTSFWKQMERSAFTASLKKAVKQRTTPMAAEMLSAALDGYFSELLYEALEALSGDAPVGLAEPAIKRFFKWGHSSGTDMLAGLILGLSTLYRAG